MSAASELDGLGFRALSIRDWMARGIYDHLEWLLHAAPPHSAIRRRGIWRCGDTIRQRSATGSTSSTACTGPARFSDSG